MTGFAIRLALVLTVFILVFSTSASAYKTENPVYIPYSYGSYQQVYVNHSWAQSFKFSQLTYVTEIRVFLKRHGGPPDGSIEDYNPAAHLKMYLRAVDPLSGTVFAFKKIPITDIRQDPVSSNYWVSLSFDTPKLLDPNVEYWVVLKDDYGNLNPLGEDQWIEWDAAGGNPYSNGRSWDGHNQAYSNDDLSLSVYTAVPECIQDTDCGQPFQKQFCKMFKDSIPPYGMPDYESIWQGNFVPTCVGANNLDKTCKVSGPFSYGPVSSCGTGNLCNPESKPVSCIPSKFDAYISCLEDETGISFRSSTEVYGSDSVSYGQASLSSTLLENADLSGNSPSSWLDIVFALGVTFGCPSHEAADENTGETIPVLSAACFAGITGLTATQVMRGITSKSCEQKYSDLSSVEKKWAGDIKKSLIAVTSSNSEIASANFYSFSGAGRQLWCFAQPPFYFENYDSLPIEKKIVISDYVGRFCINENTKKPGWDSGGIFAGDVFRTPYALPGSGDAFKRACKLQSGFSSDCAVLNSSLALDLTKVLEHDNYLIYETVNNNSFLVFGFDVSCNSGTCGSSIDANILMAPGKQIRSANPLFSEYADFLAQQKQNYLENGTIVINGSNSVIVPPWTISKDASVSLSSQGSSFDVNINNGQLYNTYLLSSNYSPSALENPPKWDAIWNGGGWVPINGIQEPNGFLKELNHASSFGQWGYPSPRETVKPSISISSPQEKSEFTLGTYLTFNYDSSDSSGIEDSASFVDHVVKVGRMSRVYSGVFAEGNHTFKIAALDNNGNEQVSIVNFTLKHVTGDLNVDGKVTTADVLVAAGKIGANVSSLNYDPWADLDDDGLITQTDLDLVLQEVG